MLTKYEFTGQTMPLDSSSGRTLHRIRRLSDGLVGGWIEHEGNLSGFGSCFVYDQAQVSGNAWVGGDAMVFCHAKVCDWGHIDESAWVGGHAVVCDHGVVSGKAVVCRNATICELGSVEDDWWVAGCAVITNTYNPHK